MPFRFALESVLHFRRSVEHQEELRLRGAIQAVSRVRHYLEQLDSHRLAQQRALSQRLGDGTTAAELRFEIDCESELTSRRIELARGLAVLEQAKNRQQQILGQAKKGGSRPPTRRPPATIRSAGTEAIGRLCTYAPALA